MSIWAGYQALRNGLETIKPPNYWFDYGSRIFPVLVSPDTLPEVPDFYLCIPFAGETERFEEHSQHSIIAYWNQSIWAFARDNEDRPLHSDAIEVISKIRDDLLRYFLANPNLGGEVMEVRIVGSEREAAFDPDHPYGELRFEIEVKQLVDSSDLGPTA